MHRCLPPVLRRFFASAVSSRSRASSRGHANRAIPSRLHRAQRSRNARSRGLRRCAHPRHVAARWALQRLPAENQPWMLAKTDACPGAPFQFSQSNGVSTLTTSRLAVTLSDRDGNLTFKTAEGETLLRERSNLPRTYAAFAGHGRPLPHRGPLQPRFHRSAVRARPAPERHVQLPRQHRRARPEQHRRRHPAAGLEQRLRASSGTPPPSATSTTAFPSS